MTIRVAFLTAGFPWPLSSGGEVRTLMQLKVLASLPQVGRIRMFSLHEGQAGAREREALVAEVPKLELAEPVFHPIHLFRHRRYVPRVVWLRAVRGIPYMAAKWDSPAVRRALHGELDHAAFDVVWLNGLGMAHYLDLVRRLQPQARVVLDQQNVEHDRFVQFARRQRGLRRIAADAEWRAAKRYERDVLRSVDAVGAISADDALAFQSLAGVRSVIVPQVAPKIPRRGPDPAGARLCWIGGLAWEPNVRGIEWLVRDVWPFVRRALPDATLDIVGPGLPLDPSGAPIVPPAWQAAGITVAGFVEDLAPVYERSVAMVAPILGGTGIRIKLIEAFRHGLPAVTTPDGAAGLAVRSGQEAFIESEAEAFASRIVELVSSSQTRARMRDAGYRFLESHNRMPDAQAAIGALLGAESTSPTTSSQWRMPTIEHA